MAYCINCGQELAEGAKFCSECGTKADETKVTKESKRTTVYDGEIHKCPVCGDFLDAFELVCDNCGYERRGAFASSSLRIFTEMIAGMDDVKKAAIIREYPIPNNREDVLEFLILSSSNITGKTSAIVLEAWATMLEHCHQKALILPLSSEDRLLVRDIYNRTRWSVVGARIKHSCALINELLKRILLLLNSKTAKIIIAILLISWLLGIIGEFGDEIQDVLWTIEGTVVPICFWGFVAYLIIKKRKEDG